MLNIWVREFAHDSKVHVALLLVVADFILGVIAAIKLGTFRLSYVSDFLRNDILGKLVPYFALYVLALVAGDATVGIPLLNFGVLAGTAFAALTVAVGASIVSSIRELGITPSAPLTADTVLGKENAAPPKD